MKDPAPQDTIGYVMVLIPKTKSWQGFFITPEFDRMAEEQLPVVRAAMSGARRPAEANPSATIEAMEGVAEEDQALVGGLAAAVVEMYLANDKTTLAPRLARLKGAQQMAALQSELHMNAMKLATFAAMLRRVIGCDHYLVVGYPAPQGTRTTVERVQASDIDDARSKLLERLQLRLSLADFLNDK